MQPDDTAVKRNAVITFWCHDRSWLGWVLLLCLTPLLWVPAATAAMAIPKYTGYVNDYANLLNPATRSRLEKTLADFDRTDSTQIAVLTVNSLEGEPIDTYSIHVVDAWKIGQKGKDNGVLLLIAKKERKIRIEVGYGLEGRLTDLLSGRIIDLIITPAFRQGKFNQGIVDGVTAIIGAVKGEFTNTTPVRQVRHQGKSSPFFSYLIFALFFLTFLGNLSRRLGVVGGTLLFPLLYFAGPASFSFLMLLVLAMFGGGAGLLLPILFSTSGRSRTYYGGGYWGGGLGGGGGFSGGGGGFGGFGGGGFGGGGASGGW